MQNILCPCTAFSTHGSATDKNYEMSLCILLSVPRPAQAFDEISLGQDTGHNDDVRKPMGVAQHLGKQKRPPSAEPVQIMNPSSEDGKLLNTFCTFCTLRSLKRLPITTAKKKSCTLTPIRSNSQGQSGQLIEGRELLNLGEKVRRQTYSTLWVMFQVWHERLDRASCQVRVSNQMGGWKECP